MSKGLFAGISLEGKRSSALMRGPNRVYWQKELTPEQILNLQADTPEALALVEEILDIAPIKTGSHSAPSLIAALL